MNGTCPACTRSEIEVRESKAYLQRVVRAALKHPSWPSHRDKVRAAKERVEIKKRFYNEHKADEHSESGLS